jgi:phosphate transport system protein
LPGCAFHAPSIQSRHPRGHLAENVPSSKTKEAFTAYSFVSSHNFGTRVRTLAIVSGRFHERLDGLTAQLGEMCGMAGVAMDRATQALLRADLALAEEVITDHGRLNAMAPEAEELAHSLLGLRSRVAGDLRLIVSSLQNAADVERMGALAVHVATIARRRHPAHALPEEVNGYFTEMGRLAVEMGSRAHDVLLSGDPRKAAHIRRDDEVMDELHRRLFEMLTHRQWAHGVAAAVDVTLLGRYYERFADHAVIIARRVIFQATGRRPHEAILTYSR